MNLDKISPELVKNREIIEGNFIFCLYKDPDMFPDFPINPKDDLLLEDSRFYYGLGLKLYQLGYRSFDDATIQQYVADKEDVTA